MENVERPARKGDIFKKSWGGEIDNYDGMTEEMVQNGIEVKRYRTLYTSDQSWE
jgi:hypothetical protein